ncbi:N-acetylneuraminate lyase-like isoform X2 [Arctopsyche grandis]|uniref:N-acetylneuraminate lyase-like isoform X2 n=1 Tax=Arctopsyche grandis TaxID=121162 RepID=UPI00406D858A
MNTTSQNKKKAMNFTFRGLMCPVFTPFKPDFSLNLEKIPEYALYLKENNVHGILVNGTSGEGYSMNVEERKLVAEAWIKEAKKYNMHMMLQVGGAPLPDVITLAKHAEELKVDSILTLPELYIKPTNTNDLVDYLEIVSKAAPNTPLLYYHIPMFTSETLSMSELITEAKKSVKTFKGIKFTSNNLTEGKAAFLASGNDCVVFLGADSVLLDAFILGFDSSIGTTFNMSNLGFDIMELMKRKDNTKMTEARECQEKLSAVITTISQHGNWVQTMKAAMGLLTKIDVGQPRPPLKSLTRAQIKEISNGLVKLGLKVNI